jgi:hypothetical protein
MRPAVRGTAIRTAHPRGLTRRVRGSLPRSPWCAVTPTDDSVFTASLPGRRRPIRTEFPKRSRPAPRSRTGALVPPSRPSSHCLSRSSPLASPRRRPSIPDGRRVPRTLGAPSARAQGAAHYLVRDARPDRIAGRPGDARRDQACASLPVKDKHRLGARSSALRSADDRRHAPRITGRAMLLVDLAAARARPPGSKHVKLCATLRRRRVFSAQGQDRSGRASQKDRLAVGHTDLCPVRAQRLAHCRDDRGPALPAILRRPSPRRVKGLKSKPAPARYRVGYADSITDHPAMDRARRV